MEKNLNLRESVLSISACSLHSMNHKERFSRPQTYFHVEIFHERKMKKFFFEKMENMLF